MLVWGLIILGVATLWSEPRWVLYFVFSAALAAIYGAVFFMAGGLAPPVSDRWLNAVGSMVIYQAAFMVVGAVIVVIRGVQVRAKAKRDAAEIEAELARNHANPNP